MLRHFSSACQPTRHILNTLPYIHLGRIPYLKALDLQRFLVEKRLRSRDVLKHTPELATPETVTWADTDLLLLLEHPPTYTMGRRGRAGLTDHDLKRLEQLGAEYYETLRGGLITFHGPGQLVAYPLIDIRNFQLSSRCYVSHLERTIIDTCSQFQVPAMTTEHTGVWVDDKHKIAAIGVHLQRYVTSHGIALNCSTDLQWFKHVAACGLVDKETTSLSRELGKKIEVEEVLPAFCKSFGSVFGANMIEMGSSEAQFGMIKEEILKKI
ncbi:uncharacterized protein VTP21DRAFT_715 [Calcarisporiella thermophila]|uniref:uncharacterized protein n=1 Tax=Calcarisporiella thermophila TaxID=911321 RepID=UPI003742A0AD